MRAIVVAYSSLFEHVMVRFGTRIYGFDVRVISLRAIGSAYDSTPFCWHKLAEHRALDSRKSSHPPYCCARFELTPALAFVRFTHNYSIRQMKSLATRKALFLLFSVLLSLFDRFSFVLRAMAFYNSRYESYNNVIS